jgi:hypothetical protein
MEVQGLRGEFLLLSWTLAWPVLCNRPSYAENFFNFMQVSACLSSFAVHLLLYECSLLSSERDVDFIVRISPVLEPSLCKLVGRG